MKARLFGKLSILLLLLFTITLGLTSCSSDDDDNGTTGRYAIQLNSKSLNYTSNTALQAVVDSIINLYCPQNPGYFDSDATTANNRYYQAWTDILNYDWEHSGIDLADSTYLDLALISVSNSNQGNIVLNRRRITFPFFVYRLIVNQPSANYTLNVKAGLCVDSIVNYYSNAEDQTIRGTRQWAEQRFNDAVDSIGHYNWKRNDLAIMRGTSFTLSLVFGTAVPDLNNTIIKEQEINLSELANE